MKRVYFSARPEEFTLEEEKDIVIKFWTVNGAWAGVYDKVTKQGYPCKYPSNKVYFGDYTIEEENK